MTQYNMLEAKNNLSKICNLLINGEEDYILIAKDGKPIAKIIPYEETHRKKPGSLKNKYSYKEVDWFDDEIENLFFEEI